MSEKPTGLRPWVELLDAGWEVETLTPSGIYTMIAVVSVPISKENAEAYVASCKKDGILARMRRVEWVL